MIASFRPYPLPKESRVTSRPRNSSPTPPRGSPDRHGRHRRGILAYYDCRISTGPLEGTNNKIKTMQRQAYGFRDQEFFKLKILAIHEAKYALVG